MKVKLSKKVSGDIDIVMDSAGLKTYGEGEWKVCTQGQSKRRIWRKLHLVVEPESGEVQEAERSQTKVSDAAMVTALLLVFSFYDFSPQLIKMCRGGQRIFFSIPATD